MIRNYLLLALRNLRRYPVYTFINVSGLAVGLACGFMILLYIQDELSYDRFHDGADRIVRITLDSKIQDNDLKAPITPFPLASALITEFPDVESATRFVGEGKSAIYSGERQFVIDRLIRADSCFFQVFSFPLLTGDPESVLDEPNTIVLTEAVASRIFPDGNAVGQTLRMDNAAEYRVTGVVKNVPSHSHFHFDALASFGSNVVDPNIEWIMHNFFTYAHLREGVSPKAFEGKLKEIVDKYVEPGFKQFATGTGMEKSDIRFAYHAQPLTDIHLRSQLEFEIEPNGNIKYVYIFAAVALFVLLIACINFMNLSTARSTERALEVGVRKAIGSTRLQLIGQFLSESLLLGTIAMILAIALILAVRPAFSSILGKTIELDALFTPYSVSALLFLILFMGFFAGSYPSFFLSSFKPVSVLKGKLNQNRRGYRLRSGLVVFQFATSIVLIIGTIVVYDQINYMRDKSLGFEKEHVMLIKGGWKLGPQMQTFKEKLLQDPGVAYVTWATIFPGGLHEPLIVRPEGADESVSYTIAPISVDYDYFKTLGIELSTGRTFSPDSPTDEGAFIINETAARRFGWGDQSVGKRITMLGPNQTGEIIGILKDFHLASLHEAIPAVVLRLSKQPLPNIAVRIRPGKISETISQAETLWNQFVPGQLFDYSFLDADFMAFYKADRQLGRIATTFLSLALLIAGLGLFGLASFTAQQRRKEIGIRKVLGATSSSIILLLSREYTRLMVFAFMIGAPLAYFLMSQWLEDFAYHTRVSVWTLVFAGGAALILAWITVSFQSMRAAHTDPVKSLRYE